MVIFITSFPLTWEIVCGRFGIRFLLGIVKSTLMRNAVSDLFLVKNSWNVRVLDEEGVFVE